MSWFKTILTKKIYKQADGEEDRPLLPFRPLGKPQQLPVIPGQFEQEPAQIEPAQIEPAQIEPTQAIEPAQPIEPEQPEEIDPAQREEVEQILQEEEDVPFQEQETGQPSFEGHKKLLSVNPDLKNSFEITFTDEKNFKSKMKKTVDNINKYNAGVAKRQGWDPIQIIYQPDLDSSPYQKILTDAQGNQVSFNARRVTIVGEPPVPAGTALKKLKDPKTRKLIKDENGENIEIPVRYKVIGLVKHQAIRHPAEVQLDENTQMPYLINLPDEVFTQYANKSIDPKSVKWKLGVTAKTAIPVPNIETGQNILKQNKLEKDPGVWRNYVYADPKSPKIDEPFWYNSPLLCNHCLKEKRGLVGRKETYVAIEYSPEDYDSGKITDKDIVTDPIKFPQQQIGSTCIKGLKKDFDLNKIFNRLRREGMVAEKKARQSESYGGNIKKMPRPTETILAHALAIIRQSGARGYNRLDQGIDWWKSQRIGQQIRNYFSKEYLPRKKKYEQVAPGPQPPRWGNPTEEDIALAGQILEWMRSRESDDLPDNERRMVHWSLQDTIGITPQKTSYFNRKSDITGPEYAGMAIDAYNKRNEKKEQPEPVIQQPTFPETTPAPTILDPEVPEAINQEPEIQEIEPELELEPELEPEPEPEPEPELEPELEQEGPPDFVGNDGRTMLVEVKYVGSDYKERSRLWLNNFEDIKGSPIVVFTRDQDTFQELQPNQWTYLFGIAKHNTWQPNWYNRQRPQPKAVKSTVLNKAEIAPISQLDYYKDKARDVRMSPKDYETHSKERIPEEKPESLLPGEEKFEGTTSEYVEKLSNLYEKAVLRGGRDIKEVIPEFLDKVEKKAPVFNASREYFEDFLKGKSTEEVFKTMKSIARMF